MAQNSNLVLQLLITARDQASEIMGRVGAGVRGIGDAVSSALEPLRTFGGLMAVALGIGGAQQLQERADAYIRLTNALKVATDTEEAYQEALRRVTAIAADTNSDLETTAQLYSRIGLNAQAMGLGLGEVSDLTTLISKGMQLGGASAAEYGTAVLQLTQAFGSGVLRGEEFNSVMEASPELMRQLATGLGVTIGELRGLAEQGVLTSNLVSKALLSQKDAIETAYAETVQTVEQAFTNLGSKITLFVGSMSESSGVTNAAVQSLKLLSDNLGLVTAALGGALAAALVKSTQAMVGYVQQSLAARTAAADQAIAAAAQQRATIATAEGHVAAALAAQNQAMAEQRLAQQQLLAIEAIAGLFASEEALTLARAQASAAAQNATTATQRLAAAQSALITAQGGAAASSTLLARAMGFLAGPGGLILAAVSAFALLLPMLSKNKTETEGLAASTDQYVESLSKLNVAQLNAQLLTMNEALREQEAAVRKAAFAVEYQQGWLINAREANYQAAEAADELTRRQGALADEEQKLAALQERHNAILVEQGQRQRTATEATGQAQIQAIQLGLAMKTLIATLEESAKQQKALSTAEQARLDSLIAVAKATGDYQALETLTIQLAQERARSAQEQAKYEQEAATAALTRVEALEKEYAGYQQLTPVQEKALITAKADATLKQQQAAASQALATQLEQQAEQTQQAGIALNAYLDALKDTTEQSRIAADTDGRLVSAQKSLLQASYDLAIAQGREADAREYLLQLARNEANQATNNAQIKNIEATAAEKVLLVLEQEAGAILASGKAIDEATEKRLTSARVAAETAVIEAQAAGQVAEAERQKAASVALGNVAKKESADATDQATQATEENTEKTEKNTEAGEKSLKKTQSLATTVASLIQFWREHTKALSDATLALFEYTAGFSNVDPRMLATGIGKLSEEAINAGTKISQLGSFINELNRQMLFSSNSVGWYMDMINRSGAIAEKSYYEQKLAAEKLEEQIKKVGDAGVTAFGSTGAAAKSLTKDVENSINGFYLLNDQDLEQLRSALSDANDKLRQMQEETQSARERLAELNAEILEESGQDQQAALLRQQLDYQQQLAEIERQRTEAQAAGNQELLRLLTEQETKLRTLNELKTANIQADADAATPQQTRAEPRTATPDRGGGLASPERTYTLNLTVGNQTLRTTTTTDPAGFLAAIETAKRSAA